MLQLRELNLHRIGLIAYLTTLYIFIFFIPPGIDEEEVAAEEPADEDMPPLEGDDEDASRMEEVD